MTPLQRANLVAYRLLQDKSMVPETRNFLMENIGVGAQSTLGGKTFCPKIYVGKINKIPEFYVIFARKIFQNLGEANAPSPCPGAPISYANNDPERIPQKREHMPISDGLIE